MHEPGPTKRYIEIGEAAADLDPLEERVAYIEMACEGDLELKRQVLA